MDTYPDSVSEAIRQLQEWSMNCEPRNVFAQIRDFPRFFDMHSHGARINFTLISRYFEFAAFFPRLRFFQDAECDDNVMRIIWWHPEDGERTRFMLDIFDEHANAPPHVQVRCYEALLVSNGGTLMECSTSRNAADMAAEIASYHLSSDTFEPIAGKIDIVAMICEEDEHDSTEWVKDEGEENNG